MAPKMTLHPTKLNLIRFVFLCIIFTSFFYFTLPAQAQNEKNIKQKIELVEKVYGIINGFIKTYEIHIGHMPKDFWQDRYLLGKFHAYINFYIIHNMKIMKIPLTQEEIIHSEALLLNEFTKDNTFSSIKRIIDLSKTGDKEFGRGVKNATKTLSVMVGKVDHKDPDIKEAKKLAASLTKLREVIPKKYHSKFGVGEENIDLYLALTEILFFKYAKTKWKQ